MEGCPSFQGGAVYPDAFRDLQDKAPAGLWIKASGAHFLCGQYLCVQAAAKRKDHVLYGCQFLPLFYWQGGSVRE